MTKDTKAEALSLRDHCYDLRDRAGECSLNARFHMKKCEGFFATGNLEEFCIDFRYLESEAEQANTLFDTSQENVKAIWEIVNQERNVTHPAPEDEPYVRALTEADRDAMMVFAEATYTTSLLRRAEALLASLAKGGE